MEVLYWKCFTYPLQNGTVSLQQLQQQQQFQHQQQISLYHPVVAKNIYNPEADSSAVGWDELQQHLGNSLRSI